MLFCSDVSVNECFCHGQDAQAALLKYNSVDKFTISSRAVMVDYIHAGVFVPIIEARGANADKFTFRASANAALRLAYWDDEAYVCELPLVEPERHRQSKKDGHKGSGARAGGDRAVDASGADIEHEGKSKKRKAEAAGLVAKKVCLSRLRLSLGLSHDCLTNVDGAVTFTILARPTRRNPRRDKKGWWRGGEW